MPKRTDINKIMIIGSGPIVIGQACEFDYSGTQACRVLREEGYYVILVNSNPATIMTDFKTADRTYIEPVIPEIVSKIIAKELPDAILPTLGGQTGLNIVLSLSELGILEDFNVEIIGASLESIEKAESRNSFKKIMECIGIRVAESGIADTLDKAKIIANKIDFPLIVRASFTMGGAGSCIVKDLDEFEESVLRSLRASPTSQVILEESLIGWKEYELELMRDYKDNVVVVCSIENIDPMGIHTGDSMTVAPIQTLTDKEYQIMRNTAIKIIREIGVTTGGANVQFAVNPVSGEMAVVEMNPRVSRSSALASKATGFPIAKIAAKLAIGYALDEIRNDITGKTTACFEPSIDYCIVKIPVWDTDKFHESEDVLTTMMKSVGETMAIGRTFKEALQKAIRGLGNETCGFSVGLLEDAGLCKKPLAVEDVLRKLSCATSKRLAYIYHAFCLGINISDIAEITGIDSWFIFQFNQIFKEETAFRQFISNESTSDIFRDLNQTKIYKEALIKVKKMGFSDIHIADLMQTDENKVEKIRQFLGVRPVYKSVDTCAAEFHATSPYFYSTYESENEVDFSGCDKKVIILGSGPNRIGQGIEFDCCCVHASLALREEGVGSIMINSNPGTVSTDYDVSNRLYFEPLTYEDVMNVISKENPDGVIVQFGGQIPLNLSKLLEKAGVLLLGTQFADINRAEDRSLFKKVLISLELDNIKSVAVDSIDQAVTAAKRIGYPVILRPSFVLGGRAINIVHNCETLVKLTQAAISVSRDHPVLIDKFLQNAMEVDVDLISDGVTSVICGIMEHIERAGIHSGDSACVLPPQNINPSMLDQIVRVSKRMALELKIIGLMNIQYAIRENILYVIEVNPRASRTIPFVSLATGIPIVKIATKVMLGKKLAKIGLINEVIVEHVAVKEAVFPFDKFINSNIKLGPSMKSTGEVMGFGPNFAAAYAKAQLAAGQSLPTFGKIFLGCCYENRRCIIDKFEALGFDILLAKGPELTEFLNIKKRLRRSNKNYISVENAIEAGEIQLVILLNDEDFSCESVQRILRVALKAGVPYVTTFSGALAVYDSIEFLLTHNQTEVKALQDYYNH